MTVFSLKYCHVEGDDLKAEFMRSSLDIEGWAFVRYRTFKYILITDYFSVTHFKRYFSENLKVEILQNNLLKLGKHCISNTVNAAAFIIVCLLHETVMSWLHSADRVFKYITLVLVQIEKNQISVLLG